MTGIDQVRITGLSVPKVSKTKTTEANPNISRCVVPNKNMSNIISITAKDTTHRLLRFPMKA